MFIQGIKVFSFCVVCLLYISRDAIGDADYSGSSVGSIGVVHANNKYIWIEYCPDNTCDVLRAPVGFPEDKLVVLGGAYFYYFSGYYNLEGWRRDLNVKRGVDKGILSLAGRGCKSMHGRELAKCEMLRWGRKHHMNLISVRYDEGLRVANKIKLEDAL